MIYFEDYLIWFISFLVYLLILYIGYKISYKLGIKKALYRTTYILLSIIFAFILSPFVNRALFNLDLSEFDITLKYKGISFYTLIDYTEEVIAHSDFLNDIYKYVPSLKSLFMDFPEVILAPVTYVLLFIVFIICWMPLYLYLSYRRKRSVLYERKEKKKCRVWAGVLGAFQCVIIISTILTPINGFNRIYHNAIEGTLNDEYDSICDENKYLKKYEKYCNLIDVYDSTIFASVGGKGTINDYIFDALTRISYDGGYTSISKEASLIVKSTIVLDQSGLLDSISEGSDIIPISLIIGNNLSDEDVDIIMETLSKSKYSEELLTELGTLVTNTLNNLLVDLLKEKKFTVDYSLDKEEIISEIKIALNAIRILTKDELLTQVLQAIDKITYFLENVPNYKRDDIVMITFISNLVKNVNLDNFMIFCESLFDSQIFNKAIPYIIDAFLGDLGFNFSTTNGDILFQLNNFLSFGKLVQKYQPTDFFELISSLNDEELLLFADLATKVVKSPETQGFIDFILSIALGQFKVYSLREIYNISDWRKEVYVLKDFCVFMNNYRKTGKLDLSLAIDIINHKDSQVTQVFLSVLKGNFSSFLKLALSGGDLL